MSVVDCGEQHKGTYLFMGLEHEECGNAKTDWPPDQRSDEHGELLEERNHVGHQIGGQHH